jgi:P-type Cu+ transporter
VNTFFSMDLDNGRVVFGEAVSESHAIVKDPVCGMESERANAAAATDFHGDVYYFCSAGCKLRFLADPRRYVSARESESP